MCVFVPNQSGINKPRFFRYPLTPTYRRENLSTERSKLIEEINREVDPEQIVSRDRKGTGYVCPACDSGTHEKGTGLSWFTRDDGKRVLKCQACGETFDIIDLIRKVHKVDFNNALEIGASLLGKSYHYEAKETKHSPAIERTEGDMTTKTVAENTESEKTNYASFYEECTKRENYSYLLSRGISVETQRLYRVGYDPNWINPVGKFKAPSERCIIPISDYGYLARSISQDDSAACKLSVGSKAPLFNQDSLKTEDVVFIVEGEIDALSCIEVGKQAIALSGAANQGGLVKALSKMTERPAIVLLLDSDSSGKREQAKLMRKLEEINVSCISGELSESDKDPNNALQTDREAFSRYLDILYVKALEKAGQTVSTSNFINELIYDSNRSKGFEAKTGFECFDKERSNFFGGLHEGLYCIGAISSLGKTTFCLQLADQIAERGTDVIFFSLEQSRKELMSKSISRYTALVSKREGLSRYAKTNMDILHPKKNASSLFREREERDSEAILNQAIEQYKKAADNLYIVEGTYRGQRVDIPAIVGIVKDHIDRTGRKPVVFIDYLQMISLGVDSKKTDKQLTDSSVFELKSLSRNYGIPVIAISSFNRENYTEPVSMQSFLSSSGIEYSSDILIGLQYKGMGFDVSDKDEKSRKARIRGVLDNARWSLDKRYEEGLDIELVCLKNRNGNTFTADFNLVAWHSLYTEKGGAR